MDLQAACAPASVGSESNKAFHPLAADNVGF